MVYFDDILIYNKSYDDHVVHLRCVLEALRCEKLYANWEKCVFYMDRVIFLVFIVSSQGV